MFLAWFGRFDPRRLASVPVSAAVRTKASAETALVEKIMVVSRGCDMKLLWFRNLEFCEETMIDRWIFSVPRVAGRQL